ncbi:hypothetical protein [Metalysinibacillus jejuensis]|uniref:hypothetical protein n=1 Tax=Metalysinibacillus jejuensis TaxID=914327 RepID=UPI000D3A40CE|nr:hypothetical protein [Metalysinibacillus jejuensis]
MGQVKKMMMEFDEAERDELNELIDNNLDECIKELKAELEEQQEYFNDIVSKVIEDEDDVDLSELDDIVENIKNFPFSIRSLSDKIERREELKEKFNIK